MRTWKLVSALLFFGLLQMLLFMYLNSPSKETLQDHKIDEVLVRKEKVEGGDKEKKKKKDENDSPEDTDLRKLFKDYRETYVPVKDYYVKPINMCYFITYIDSLLVAQVTWTNTSMQECAKATLTHALKFQRKTYAIRSTRRTRSQSRCL